MLARIAILLATTLPLFLALTACSGDEEDVFPTPVAPAVLIPTATQPPVASTTTPAPFPNVDGLAIYLRDKDLWAGPVDQPSTHVSLTTASLGAGYAGSWRDPQGRLRIVFTNQLSGDSNSGGDFAVSEITWPPTQPPAELFSFRGGGKQSEFHCCNASIRADGIAVYFSDASGDIRVWVRGMGVTGSLVSGQLPCEQAPRCYGNFMPLLPPVEYYTVAIRRIFYEGDELILVPLGNPAWLYGTGLGASFMAWTADGGRICVPRGGYGGSPLAIHEPDIPPRSRTTVVDAHISPDERPTDPLLDPYYVTGCAWAPDGSLALSYILQRDATLGLNTQRIALLAPDGRVLLKTTTDTGQVIAWLPDGSGVIHASARAGQSSAGGLHLLTRSGQRHPLPFLATWLLAVLPETQ